MDRNWIRLLAVTSTLLIVGACSATRLAYDNADFFLLRWVDRYIEPTPAQDEILEAGLDEVLGRHRTELLPDYVLYLRGAAVVVADGLSRAELQCLVSSFEELYARTVELIIPLAAAILAELNEEQQERLARRLEKDDARFEREWLQEERRDRLARRSERFLERIEEWTGELYARQEASVREATLAFPDTAPAWYAYRLGQQEELLRLVGSGAGAESVEVFLRDWWIVQSGLEPDLSEQIDEAVQRFVDMVVALDATLTVAQRERVVSRLELFADALEPALNPDDRTLVAAADRPAVCGVSATNPRGLDERG